MPMSTPTLPQEAWTSRRHCPRATCPPSFSPGITLRPDGSAVEADAARCAHISKTYSIGAATAGTCWLAEFEPAWPARALSKLLPPSGGGG